MKKRFFVWIIKWSDDEKKQVKALAGEFTEYLNANLFAKAYREHFSASAEIETVTV
jgi:hypothetical protein